MKTIEIKGSLRTDKGKTAAKTLRKQGMVPCILYGNKSENVDFAVPAVDLKGLIYTPNSYVVNIDIDGQKHTGIMREVQYHPVSDNILHIDFIKVDGSKPVTIDIPVAISGNSEGVKQGGKLQILNRKLKVSAMVDKLPDSLPIDITNLGLGKSIFVGELEYDDLTILTPKNSIVCAVKMTRAAMGAQAAAAAEAKKD
ncbi:MAG: 50S ribosomal protein L25/general stress protein Ctc [Prevotellaceae bacterium]|jgi:large subunit ribosomal protein L25|nr:50S ribosomal protein L25/general stress protein Ctc [Prevotellaceae bacterium]